MSALGAARTLRDRAALIAADAGLDLHATIDPAEALAETLNGRHVLLVNPPAVTYETYTVRVYGFEVILVSPTADPLDAWPALDEITEVLAEPLAIDTARLTMWQPQEGQPWPCSHLTLDTAETE